jgi:mono/diheme cytochrome c family protein
MSHVRGWRSRKVDARWPLLAVIGWAAVAGARAPRGDVRNGAAAHDPITTKITYAREIRAILLARCASCHAAGGPAPMPLSTYEDVRPWARAIRDQVLTRRMPKWQAVHGYGSFANDPSLTPTELAIVAAWVNGGMPPGPSRTTGSGSTTTADVAFRRGATAIAIPASASQTQVGSPSRWIAGWDFAPGDPLITAATFTSGDDAPIGTWVAGDAPVRLPADTGIRITSPIRVKIQRRAATDYEQPVAAKQSLLLLMPSGVVPQRRIWVERTACGVPRTGRTATLIAVRPLLEDGGAARLWLERPGAPRTILGWFRDYESRYPRTYWLARAAELSPESRVQGDGPCTIEVTLAAR